MCQPGILRKIAVIANGKQGKWLLTGFHIRGDRLRLIVIISIIYLIYLICLN